MIPEKVENPRYVMIHHDIPALVVDLDGLAVLISDQNLNFPWNDYNAVNLSPPEEFWNDQEYWGKIDQYQFIVPPDPDNGRLGFFKIFGATNDHRVAILTRRYLADLQNDTFRVGPVKPL